ncbi:MAG: tetratricopeptide repeat protein [Pseudomonadota bacterium]
MVLSLLKKLALAASVLPISIVSAEAASTSRNQPTSLSGNYLAGVFASKARDTEAAAGFIANALEKDPTNPELITRALMLELGKGAVATAEKHAAKVVANDERHRIARLVLALKAFREGDQEASREHLSHSAYTPIGQLSSALATGWSWAASGDLDRAILALRKLESTESFAVYQAFHSALIADFLNVPERARSFYERTYDNAGGSLRVAQAYANFLERHGEQSKALDILRKFQTTTTGHPLVEAEITRIEAGRPVTPFIGTASQGAAESLFGLASALTDQSGFDLALLYAQLSVSIRPRFALLRTLLGDVYQETKRHKNAIKAYEAVPVSSPLRPYAEIRIAVNYDRTGEPGIAEARLKKQIELRKDDHLPPLTLGNLQRGHEKFAEAIPNYSRAIANVGKVENKHWTLFYFRGIAYERTKQWPLAETDFKKALELRPEQPLVLNYLGYSWIEQGAHLRKALGMIERAVELRPNDGYIVDSLGWAHYKLKNYEDAVKNLERAVELKPQDPVINDHLGDAYWRVGRKLEARFQWLHAKDNKPELDVLKKIQKKLESGLEPDAVVPAEVKQEQKDDKT